MKLWGNSHIMKAQDELSNKGKFVCGSLAILTAERIETNDTSANNINTMFSQKCNFINQRSFDFESAVQLQRSPRRFTHTVF